MPANTFRRLSFAAGLAERKGNTMTPEHAEYESKTVVTREGETIAVLRIAFEAVCNEQNWKYPWAAIVESRRVGLVIRATQFFHADTPEVVGIEPITGRIHMVGHGYKAD